jgi:cytochrome b6-f complex iron-sulfur subunit
MALVDDLKADVEKVELTRRAAMGKAIGWAFGIAGIGTMITLERYMRPNVLFEPATRFKVARPEEIPLGKVLALPQQKLYVAHGEAGFYAMSAVCTHLGCMTRYAAEEKTITCPCHGSRFDLGGRVNGGPAPRPLDRLELSLKDGALVVDTRKRVGPDDMLKV